MSMDTNGTYYASGPYGDVYEIWWDSGFADTDPGYCGTVHADNLDAALTLAKAEDWPAFDALNYRAVAESESEPHTPELAARFAAGAATINAAPVKIQVLRGYLRELNITDESPYIQMNALTQAGRKLLTESVYGEE